MMRKHGKKISVQQRRNPKEMAELVAKVAAMSEVIEQLVLEKTEAKAEYELKLAAMSERIDGLVLEKIEGQAQMDDKLVALEIRTLEAQQAVCTLHAKQANEKVEQKLAFHGLIAATTNANTEHAEKLSAMSVIVEKLVQERADAKAEHEEKLAAISDTVEKLVLEKKEEKSQMDHKLVALENRTLELEQEGQTKPAESMDFLGKLKAIHSQVREVKAEFEEELSALSVTVQRLLLSRTEVEIQFDKKLTSFFKKIEERFVERMDIKLFMDGVLYDVEERANQHENKAKAEYEEKLAAISDTVEKLVLEKKEDKSQMDHKVVALENRTLELEGATQTKAAESMEFLRKLETIYSVVMDMREGNVELEEKMAALSEAIESPDLQKVEAKAEYEEKLAAISETVEKLVLEKKEDKSQMDHKVVALENRTLELEGAAQTKAAESLEFLRIMEAIYSEVLDMKKGNVELEEKMAALSEAIESPDLQKVEAKAEYEEKLAAISETVEKLVLEKKEDKSQMDHKVVALENRTLELEGAAQTKAAESMEFLRKLEAIYSQVLDMKEENLELEEKMAALSEAIESPDLQKVEESKEFLDRLEAINLNVMDMREENMELEAKMTALSEAIGSPDLQKMEAKAEYEEKLAAISETVEKLVLEKKEDKSQMDHKVVALENRTLELERAAQTKPAESMEFLHKLEAIYSQVLDMKEENLELEEKMAALSEAIESPDLQKVEESKEFLDRLEAINLNVMDMREENMELEAKMTALSEAIGSPDLQKMEAKAEYEEKLAAISETVEKLVLEKKEDKSQMDHKVVALENRTLELERAAQTKPAESMEFLHKLEAIYSQVLDMKEENLELEEKMAALSEAIESPDLQKVEESKEFLDRLEAIQLNVMDMREENMELEAKMTALSEAIGSPDLQKMEAKAEYEEKLAAISETVEKLVLEKKEDKSQMDHKVVALENRTLELERAAQTKPAESMEFLRIMEAIYSHVLDMKEEKSEMDHKVVALENRTLELEGAAQTKAVVKAEFEEELSALSVTVQRLLLWRTEVEIQFDKKLTSFFKKIEERFVERMDIKLFMDGVLYDVEERANQHENKMKEEFEEKLSAVFVTIERCFLEKTVVKAEFEEKLAAISKTVEKCFLERTVAKFEQKPAIRFETVDSLHLGNMEEKMVTMSTEPLTTGPTGQGSCDPSGLREERSVQSNRSEQLIGIFRKPRRSNIYTDELEPELEESCKPLNCDDSDSELEESCMPLSFEYRDSELDNSGSEKDSCDTELDGEQRESPAALDSSEGLTPQTERGLLPLPQSLNAQPASDLDEKIYFTAPYELEPELEESCKPLNCDDSDSELEESCMPLSFEYRDSELDNSGSEEDSCDTELDGEQRESPAALDSSEGLTPQTERGLHPLPQSLNAQPASDLDEKINLTAPYELEPELEESCKPLSCDDRDSELEESCKPLNCDDSDSELDDSGSEEYNWHTVEVITDSEEDSCDSELDGEQRESPAALDSSEGLTPQTERGLLPLPQSLNAQPASDLDEKIYFTAPYELEPELEESCKPLNCDDRDSELEESCKPLNCDDSDSELDDSGSEEYNWHTVEVITDSEEDSCDSELDGEQRESPAALDSSEGLTPQTERGLLPLPQSLNAQPASDLDEKINFTAPYELEPELEESCKPLNCDDRDSELEESCKPLNCDDSDSELDDSGSEEYNWHTVEVITDSEEDSCDSELDGEQRESPAALDSSEGLTPQTERGLLPLPQSLNAQPASDLDEKINFTAPCKRSMGPKLRYSLEYCLALLSDDDGLLKVKALELIQELAESQPEALIQRRQEVCRAVVPEVMSHHWSVSNAAVWTLADLFTFLKRDLDPELDWVANALLQKTASDNKALRQIANVALGRMISSCSPIRCMEALLNGLRSLTEEDLEEKQTAQWDGGQAAVVRESIAEHLLTLVQSAGAQPFLGLQQEMLEHFLSTVSHLSQDASERVRSCAKKTLCLLSAQ